MEKFRTLVLVVDTKPGGSLDLDVFYEDDMIDFHEEHGNPDDIVVAPAYWGWNEGGLDKLLRGGTPMKPLNATPMYFHGSAMFADFNDAKNSYLMNPKVDTCTGQRQLHNGNEIDEYEDVHTPFGMVIPEWTKHQSATLQYATVILFWMEEPI